MREAQEQVADDGDAGVGGGFGRPRTHAVQSLQRDVEEAGTGTVNWGVTELGWAQLYIRGESAHCY